MSTATEQATLTGEPGIPTTADAGENPTVNGQAEPQQTPTPYKTFASQQDFDNEAARIRGAAERKATEAVLKALGLNPGDESKIAEIKKAWDNSLTEAEKQTAELAALRETVARETARNEEKDYTIAALAKISGKTTEEVNKLVLMARGLKTADNTIEQCLDEVLSLTRPNETPPTPTVPVGQTLPQPDAGKTPAEQQPKNLREAMRQQFIKKQ